jgi:hypothetical protein
MTPGRPSLLSALITVVSPLLPSKVFASPPSMLARSGRRSRSLLLVPPSRNHAVSSSPSIYRTGLVVAKFFEELADVLDRFATYADQLYLVGDVNVHFEKHDDGAAADFIELITGYGLTQCVVAQTHDAGGTIDVVCCRQPVDVVVEDIGISDHRLLSWTADIRRPPPVYVTSSHRQWR